MIAIACAIILLVGLTVNRLLSLRSLVERLVRERTAHFAETRGRMAHCIADLERTVLELRRRVAMLEQEVAECRTAQEETQGRYAQLKAINGDLTRLIAVEEERNRAREQAMLQREKLASIGQLAAGVAHEINNPIGFVQSNLGTFRNYVDAVTTYISASDALLADGCPEELLRRLEECGRRLDLPFILEDMPLLVAESIEGIERVSRIVQALRDFARPDERDFREADLNDCVRSTVPIVHNALKYVADLVLDLNAVTPVHCNPHQISQVITNLLVNAAHAVGGHGTVTVATRSDGDRVLLSVSDTGCGIPEDVLPHIFEPFFTTKAPGKGTGLGLSISCDIIKQHDGAITVKSEPGRGTTFTVSLPAAGHAGGA